MNIFFMLPIFSHWQSLFYLHIDLNVGLLERNWELNDDLLLRINFIVILIALLSRDATVQELCTKHAPSRSRLRSTMSAQLYCIPLSEMHRILFFSKCHISECYNVIIVILLSSSSRYYVVTPNPMPWVCLLFR